MVEAELVDSSDKDDDDNLPWVAPLDDCLDLPTTPKNRPYMSSRILNIIVETSSQVLGPHVKKGPAPLCLKEKEQYIVTDPDITSKSVFEDFQLAMMNMEDDILDSKRPVYKIGGIIVRECDLAGLLPGRGVSDVFMDAIAMTQWKYSCN